MGIVSEYIRNLIAKQVDDNGLVVLYNPDGAYSEAVDVLDLPETTVLRYKGSFERRRGHPLKDPLSREKLPPGKEKIYFFLTKVEAIRANLS